MSHSPSSDSGAPRPPLGRRHWALLAAIALVHFLLLVAKPAHIDDTIYLETVKGILADPLRPLCNTLLWEMEPRPIYSFALNPPLYNYQQALVVLVFGWSLPVLHLLATAYVFLAGLAVLAIARRFTRWPIAALLLVMSSPTLLPQTNLMLDVPAMALVCAAVASWIEGVDRGSRRWLVLGAASAAAAILTKYNSIVVLPLRLCYSLLQRRPRSAVWLLVPVAALGLWCLHNRLFMPGGTIHMLQAQSRFGFVSTPLFAQLIKLVESWGSSFLCVPVLAVCVQLLRRSWIEIAAAALVICVVAIEAGILFGTMSGPGTMLGWVAAAGAKLTQSEWNSPTGPRLVPIWPEYLAFVSNGGLLFAGILLGSRGNSGSSARMRDTLFLLAWVLGVSLFTARFAPHFAPRYFFPAFAALPLLELRALETCSPRLPRIAIAATVAVQIVLGLLLAASDHAFAAGSRDYVEELSTLDTASKEPIRYVGHWGFQHYAEQTGRLRCLASSDPPPPIGGLVAIVVDTASQEYPDWVRHIAAAKDQRGLTSEYIAPGGSRTTLRFRRALPTQTVPHAWPFQTIGFKNGALLYAPGGYHGLLPYAWSREPFLMMEVLQRVE